MAYVAAVTGAPDSEPAAVEGVCQQPGSGADLLAP